jgi:Tol biopolymer transport system component
MEGKRIDFPVWIMDSDGEGLRKIAEASCLEDAFLAPNLITWGGYPGTIVYPEVVDGKMTAVHLDLTSMRKSRFLPHAGEAYFVEFSPDRDKAAVLLYRDDLKLAELYLGDIPLGTWWKLDALPCDEEALEFPNPTIYWSPDGSRFAIPSLNRRLGGRHFIHLYDSQSRLSTRIDAEPPETGFFWNADGSALVYSIEAGTSGKNPPGLYRADIRTGKVNPVLLMEEHHVLSWNPQDDRIYLIHQSEEGEGMESPAISSCSPTGMDARWLVAPPLSGDWGWDVPPGGDKLLFITDHSEVRLLHLNTGYLSPVLKLH